MKIYIRQWKRHRREIITWKLFFVWTNFCSKKKKKKIEAILSNKNHSTFANKNEIILSCIQCKIRQLRKVFCFSSACRAEEESFKYQIQHLFNIIINGQMSGKKWRKRNLLTGHGICIHDENRGSTAKVRCRQKTNTKWMSPEARQMQI